MHGGPGKQLGRAVVSVDAGAGGHQAAAAVRYHDLAACMCALDKARQLSVLVAAHIAQQAQHGQQLIDVEGPTANCVLHSLHGRRTPIAYPVYVPILLL